MCQVEELFSRVLELPPDERSEALRAACGTDAALHADVESLLQHAEPPNEFLSGSALGAGLSVPAASVEDLGGQLIGPYRIIQRLGSGGMGSVYAAVRADGQFEQQVAIKIVKRGMDTDEILRRFGQERRTLAALRHPNIAQLLDAGALPNGRPYLVMEFVKGVAIDRYCDEHRLTIADRLRLFCTVCEAVRTAHQKLVVHRDLKPDNILVGDDGAPKLLDFGVAKVLLGTGSAEITALEEQRFTPEYASPEQASGQPVNTVSDVYSLGIILYELLAGSRPYRFLTRTAAEVRRVICEASLTPPSAAAMPTREAIERSSPGGPDAARCRREATMERLSRKLRGDLDTIVLKATQKDPARRYVSVEQLIGDVERYLSGRPVMARPESLTYRARKFVGRNAIAVALGAMAVTTLVVGFGVALWQAGIARQERDAAYLARDQAEATGDFLQRIMSAADPQNEGPDTTIRAVLDASTALVDSDLKQQPLVQAAVRSALGRTYLGLGLLADAERNIESAHALRQSLLPPGHHDLAESQFDLAHVYYAKGQYADAEELLVSCLETHRRLRGPDSPDTARVLNDLGAVRRAERKIPEAEATLREALKIREKLSGRESLEAAETMNNLAGVLRARQDLKGSLALLEESLQIRRRLLRPEHPLVIQSMANVAVAVSASGDLPRGEQLLRQVVELDRRTFGNDHPALAVDLTGLARVLMKQNRPGEAEPLLREVLEIRRRRLAATDERLPLTAAVLGECLVAQGRDADAEPLLAEALHQARDVLHSRDGYWNDVAAMLEATRRRVKQRGEKEPSDVDTSGPR